MTDERERRARLWFWWTWTVIGIVALLYVAWQLLQRPLAIAVPPLALAVVIVYVLNPVVRRLADRGVPRVASAALAYVVLVGAVVAGVSFLVPVIGEQVAALGDRAPEMGRSLQGAINRQLDTLGIDYRVELGSESLQAQETVRQYLLGRTGTQFGQILASAGSVARGILHAAVIVLLGPVLAFYLLADLPNVLESLRRIIPPGQRSEVVSVAEGIMARVGGYFRGQLLVATFVGVATAAGLLAVGLPFWALVALITGVFNLVPLIGPFVGGAIGVVVALTAGDGLSQAVWVVAVMTVVQQVDNHVVSPNVMSRTVEMHPITVMLGLLVAGSLYGIVGMLVAVPAIAAAKLVLLHLLATRAPWATEDLPRPATAGRSPPQAPRELLSAQPATEATAEPEDARTPR
ncbi:MAG: AI-2E family transporter [Actinobacteria bacterium]|nr:AI-2E family transporter [Actinomycetota bacterium]